MSRSTRRRKGTKALIPLDEILTSFKTVLSSIVVDHLRKYFCDLNIPVLCLYLNYKERMVQTLDNLIGSLLKQLIQHQEDQFQSEKVRALFKEAKNESPPILDCVYQALQSEISIFQR